MSNEWGWNVGVLMEPRFKFRAGGTDGAVCTFSETMEGAFTEKDYYAEHFVPKDYLQMYYKYDEEGSVFLTPFLKAAHRIFLLEGIKGETLIDIGSGPTIHQFLSSCESFREIIATDYTDQNREELQRWLKKDPEAFDWSPVVKSVCELEGDREKWPEKEKKVQRAIKDVLRCDVTQPNPLAPLVLPPADCLTTSFCLESACKDLPTYRSALKNISSLVKPGGHLILCTAFQDSYYMAGQRRFSCLYLEKEAVEEAVREAGFVIKSFEVTKVNFSLSLTDATGIGFLVAQKCSI